MLRWKLAYKTTKTSTIRTIRGRANACSNERFFFFENSEPTIVGPEWRVHATIQPTLHIGQRISKEVVNVCTDIYCTTQTAERVNMQWSTGPLYRHTMKVLLLSLYNKYYDNFSGCRRSFSIKRNFLPHFFSFVAAQRIPPRSNSHDAKENQRKISFDRKIPPSWNPLLHLFTFDAKLLY